MEDYKQDKEHNSIKLLLKNGEEIIITEKDSVKIILEDDKILLIKKKDEKAIYLNDIETIEEEKFNLIRMCCMFSLVPFFLTFIFVIFKVRINLAG